MAGQQPLEPRDSPPGAFPETPAETGKETEMTRGFVSDSNAPNAAMFGLGPQTTNMIPESSLPMGSAAANQPDVGPTVSSAAPDSTTAQLAGQQPLEPRGVPQVVDYSQAKAGSGPEASADAEAVAEKGDVETELKQKVPEQPSTSESGLLGKSEGGITGMAAGDAAAAGAAAAGTAHALREKATETTGKDPVSVLPETVQQSIDGTNQNSTVQAAPGLYPLMSDTKIPQQTKVGEDVTVPAERGSEPAPGVPEEVVTSQKQAGFSPEASADPEMVREKTDMEHELAARVQPAEGAGEPAPTASAALSATAPGAAAEPTAGVAALTMDNDKQAEGTGLNASGDTPAKLPIATTGGLDTPGQQEQRAVSEVSPPASNTAAQTEPVVTIGTDSSKAPISVTATAPAVEPSGLNASAADPAKVPVATTGGLDTPAQQEDRTASDMAPPAADTAAQNTPVVTTGIDSSKAPAENSGAPQLADPTANVAPISMDNNKTAEDSALNASADTPAKVPVATTGGLETPIQQEPQDSRDVSPMSRPATNQSGQGEPVVSTGVDSSKTPSNQRQSAADTKETLANAQPFGKQENDPPSASTPQKERPSGQVDSPASQRTATSQISGTDSQKKDKRKSLFGRIKDKLKS